MRTPAAAILGWGLLAAAGAGPAVVTPPAAAAASSAAAPSVESRPLQINPDAAARSAERQQQGGSAADADSPTGVSVPQVVGALAVVVGLIFGLRYVAGRLSLVPNKGSAGAVRVVGRSALSPKQQVLLIQVGRRLLVVGDSGGAMSPLCEITDPDEVAALVGEAKAAAASSAAKRRSAVGAFDKLFHGAAEPFRSPDDAPVLSPPRDDDGNVNVDGLLDKVRGLRQQFGRA